MFSFMFVLWHRKMPEPENKSRLLVKIGWTKILNKFEERSGKELKN